ncbi:FadR/GntR family transcriptional regulator [Nonomuraea gerenzanensis]|uniref:Transcriptional regulator, GntR family n=1 Tax=Nonomuraea gerenzanensis TaxID=93944 RepID=A0A1M4E8I7_9ACTN|nr:FCD domain-containing protein [Nonomuraea gerenzanensis]UBU17317.1 FCD domain-containing protein [Nonomuraea gerenzanensis]SBO95064.1 Transcriptional regulator, GntR family [Nonomuraea gerenzanensis]
MKLQGLHGQVVDGLGRSLAAGELRGGEVLRLEDVQERFGVSRTVAREAVRVLESKRLVSSRPRVGVTVRPMSAWNLYDPQVIRWRLTSPGREAQLRELAELRAAVEPAAAALAARQAAPAVRQELMRHARALTAAAGAGDRERFVTADAAFHRVLLGASGNGMFAQLAEVTEELLLARRDLLLLPERLDDAAVRRHLDVAAAVAEGRGEDAARAAGSIVAAAWSEVESILDGTTCPLLT